MTQLLAPRGCTWKSLPLAQQTRDSFKNHLLASSLCGTAFCTKTYRKQTKGGKSVREEKKTQSITLPPHGLKRGFLRTGINAINVPVLHQESQQQRRTWRTSASGVTGRRRENLHCINAPWNREDLVSSPFRGNEYELRSLNSNPPCSSG